MPDVIVHLETKNSLFLIEVVTSYGSIDIKRHNELKGLFRGVSLNPIFGTVFSFRKVMVKCLHNIGCSSFDRQRTGSPHPYNGEHLLDLSER